MKCAKCMGSGKVAFKHVNGGRCFDCNGSGQFKFTAAAEKARQNLAADVRKKASWVLSATADDWKRASVRQLEAARDFCQSSVPGFPCLVSAWEAAAKEIYDARKDAEQQDWLANGGW